MIPQDLHYSSDHEWIRSSGEDTVRIGITDFAQNSLGDIVFVELPKVGDTVESGKIFGSVESVKAVSDLYSPLTGTVTEINTDLATQPEKLNTDANTTWIMKLDVPDATQVDALLTADAYETFISEETGH